MPSSFSLFMRAFLAFLLSVTSMVGLAGCFTSEEKRLAELAANLICASEEVRTLAENPNPDDAEIHTKITDFQSKTAAFIKEAGYENEAAVEAEFRKIEDKPAFGELVKEKTEAQCSGAKMLPQFLASMGVSENQN